MCRLLQERKKYGRRNLIYMEENQLLISWPNILTLLKLMQRYFVFLACLRLHKKLNWVGPLLAYL